jgi:hypothetical protein
MLAQIVGTALASIQADDQLSRIYILGNARVSGPPNGHPPDASDTAIPADLYYWEKTTH